MDVSEKRKSLSPAGIRTSDRQIRSLCTISTTLSRTELVNIDRQSFSVANFFKCRSRYPHGLSLGCSRSFAEIAGSNPARGHGSLSIVSVVLSGRGLCDGPIPRPEDSYRVCTRMCVIECDQLQQ